MYKVIAFQKFAILDKNLKYTHRWKKVYEDTFKSKEFAIHIMRKWTDRDWLKANIQKI